MLAEVFAAAEAALRGLPAAFGRLRLTVLSHWGWIATLGPRLWSNLDGRRPRWAAVPA